MKKNDLQSEKHDKIIRKMDAEVCKGLVNDQLIFRAENRNEKNTTETTKLISEAQLCTAETTKLISEAQLCAAETTKLISEAQLCTAETTKLISEAQLCTADIRKMDAEVCKGLVNDQLIFRAENRNEKK